MSSKHPRSELAWPESSQPPAAFGAMAMPPMGFAPPDDSQSGPSLWTMLDDRMRGRWKWAILGGAALGVTLALVGYFSTIPMYRSMGAVRVVPQVPIVLRDMPEHTLPDPDRFRSTQVQMIKSDRVIDEALKDEELTRLEWSQRPDVKKAVKSYLEAERDRDSELIYVWFECEDPLVAQAVTNAVLRSYYEIYGRHNGQDMPGKMTELKGTEARLVRELNMLRDDQRKIDTRYQTTDLVALQTANLQMIAGLEMQIRSGKRELDRLERSKTAQTPGAAMAGPDMATLEAMNPLLGGRRVEWSQAQIAFDDIKQRHLPGRHIYDSAKDKAEAARRQYEDEYQKTLEFWKQQGGPNLLASNGTVKVFTAEDIVAWEKELEELKEQQQRLVADIARRSDLVYNEAATLKELDAISDRIRSLEIESKSLGGFISIANYGSRPTEPHENARRKRAIMGLALGVMASFGGFFLLGTIDRRAYGASQLHSRVGVHGLGSADCVGVLPDLGVNLADAESNDVAAHCVHQIRNQIEGRRTSALQRGGDSDERGFVMAVSSPFQGDGKTSIVMALGWSYAAAGFNTLLIDCDLVGRSLTRHLGLTGHEGLRDALAARDLNGSVSRLPIDNLSALPAGVDASIGPESVRHADLERLLDQVRDQFDIILIDTGPMLGSLESTPVTATADGVLLSVRRGRSRSRLEDCVERLHKLGVPCLGVVLNCAYRSDCNRYVSEASLAAAEEERAGRPRPGETSPPPSGPPGERNALVQAVQSTSRLHVD